MTRRSSFGLATVTVWLLAQIGKLTQGEPHGDLAHPLEVDTSSEASLSWPQPRCYGNKPITPAETWNLFFWPNANCTSEGPDAPLASLYCEWIRPSKNGCQIYQRASTVQVKPGNCTVRIFEDENCTKLVDDPNAEYGPRPPPHFASNNTVCVTMDDHPATIDSKGFFMVTCPEISMENDGHSGYADALDLSQDTADIEDGDLTKPESETDNSAAGAAGLDSASDLEAYRHESPPDDDSELPPWNCSTETDRLKWMLSFHRKNYCPLAGQFLDWKTDNWTDLDCIPWNHPEHSRVVVAFTCQCTIELFQESACEIPLDTEAAQIGPATGDQEVFAHCLELWRPGSPVNGSFRVTCPE